MTPDELRSLADEATTEGGISEGWTTYRGFTPRERRLIVLAPDLARLCADMAEQYEAFEKILTRSRAPVAEIDERMWNLVHPLLAKFSKLKP